MKKKNLKSLDTTTLDLLYKEAKRNHTECARMYKRDPQISLLGEVGQWHMIMGWLEGVRSEAAEGRQPGSRACIGCGATGLGVKLRVDPYASEMFQDETRYWMCKRCEHNSAQEL